MIQKHLYNILVILITVVLFYAEKYIDRENEDYPEVAGGKTNYSEFDATFLPTSTTGVIVTHSYFSLSYAEKHEQAEWIAYELKKEHLSKNDFERPYFVQDRSVKSGSADWRNYKNSGYDRGHLCPAGDRRFNYNAYHETFLTSNISPQDHDFNSGIWNRLEQKVRYWAKQYDGVYVVTGGILKEGLKSIGDERVSVPSAFYKIVLDNDAGKYKAVAFLIPNGPSNKSFYEYAVSIDAIETKTGIDFFPKLSEKIQQQLESNVDLQSWSK